MAKAPLWRCRRKQPHLLGVTAVTDPEVAGPVMRGTVTGACLSGVACSAIKGDGARVSGCCTGLVAGSRVVGRLFPSVVPDVESEAAAESPPAQSCFLPSTTIVENKTSQSAAC